MAKEEKKYSTPKGGVEKQRKNQLLLLKKQS